MDPILFLRTVRRSVVRSQYMNDGYDDDDDDDVGKRRNASAIEADLAPDLRIKQQRRERGSNTKYTDIIFCL